jgi:excisionase family DNA binding protein
MKHAKTLDQLLASLSRTEVLRAIAQLQRRQARDAVLLGLLQARLHRSTAAPATNSQDGALLTIPDVCKRLKVTRAYAYELVKQGALPAVRIPGEKGYVRVPRESLNRFIKENLQKGPDP